MPVFVLYMRTHEWPTKPKVHEPKEKLGAEYKAQDIRRKAHQYQMTRNIFSV